MQITGKVVKKVIGKGSKTEHEAIFIITNQGEYVLRKSGDNPFENESLDMYIGKTITAEGKVEDYLFLAGKIWISG